MQEHGVHAAEVVHCQIPLDLGVAGNPVVSARPAFRHGKRATGSASGDTGQTLGKKHLGWALNGEFMSFSALPQRRIASFGYQYRSNFRCARRACGLGGAGHKRALH